MISDSSGSSIHMGGRAMLERVMKSRGEYHGVILASDESTIKRDLEVLRGEAWSWRRHAYDDCGHFQWLKRVICMIVPADLDEGRDGITGASAGAVVSDVHGEGPQPRPWLGTCPPSESATQKNGLTRVGGQPGARLSSRSTERTPQWRTQRNCSLGQSCQTDPRRMTGRTRFPRQPRPLPARQRWGRPRTSRLHPGWKMERAERLYKKSGEAGVPPSTPSCCCDDGHCFRDFGCQHSFPRAIS